MSYDQTQRGPFGWILAGGGMLILATGAVLPRTALPATTLAAASMILFAGTFHSLRVRDAGDHLLVSFGPVPLFRRKIPYADIRGVRAARTSWKDGWGIHYAPGRGWMFNLKGFDSVELDLDNGKFVLGTDEPKRLARFIEGRISRTRRA